MLAMLIIPIYINASCTSFTLILICMLAILGIYILIKSILKVQYCNFILLDFVFSAAATLGLILICIIASCITLLLIYIDASCTSFTLILIYILAILGIYILIKGVLKV